MKIACSFVGGAGHLVPQLPLHRALAEAGHQLTVIGRQSALAAAPAELFEAAVARPDPRSATSSAIAPLKRVDVDAELTVVADHFAARAAQQSFQAVAPALVGASLLVCDELDFGAMAAADLAGVPVVVVSVIATGSLVRPPLVTPSVLRLRELYGITGSPRLRGDLFVVPFAPSMRQAASEEWADGPDTLWMRPGATNQQIDSAATAPDDSIVVTLGTEFNTESGDLFDRILAALSTIEAPAVVAIGRDLDPARFGPQPARIRVERFVDLATLIPRASVVLHHGGSGVFTVSALGGAPQIAFPMGADQPFTAERVTALGIGLAMDAMTSTPEQILGAIQQLRADTAQRTKAAALRDELLCLPSPESLLPAIMALTG
ncbi:glycosyltransferase [Agreia pratensis]|uniref:UDP:flavonoid glycosyltransferase YjiC, YdhE family n=1 Tax=Agreia pratensis TaxID=150121 RepID=A0A1X7JA25_9MICO|nr:glycosyltransferase [Agreia pratensis]SMG24191.1 UDP:flavonoid glycosyltransferase YjiC, YdhE family [Agreia pratensis]